MADEGEDTAGPGVGSGGGSGDRPERPRRADLTPRQRRKLAKEARRRTGTSGAPSSRAAPSAPSTAHADAVPADAVPADAAPPSAGGSHRSGRARGLLWLALALTAVGAAVVVVGVTFELGPWQATSEAPESVDEPAAAGGDGAVLLVTDDASGAGAARLALVGSDTARGEATVLLIPVTTVVDLPGHGTFPLGEALELGGPSLTAIAVSNLLGTRLDGVVQLDVRGWAALAGDLDPITVDVRREVVLDVGLGRLELAPGPRTLDPDGLATYLADPQDPSGELASLARAQAGLQGIFAALARESDPAGALLARAEVTGSDPAGVERTLAAVADAAGRGELASVTLPVDALGSGEQGAYRPDRERIATLVDDRFATTLPADGPGVGVGVQILDGNEIPQIAEPVAERLLDGGYRIVLSGNADRFTYDETRIVVYSADARSQAIASDIRNRLGVGEIERSAAPQSVVDVTIIVGADFTG